MHRITVCLAGSVAGLIVAGQGQAASASFACGKAHHEVEKIVCGDPALSELDRRMTATYAAAGKNTDAGGVTQLRMEQRGWAKGRNDCWKQADKPACIRDEYVRRIAELQARYRLVPARGPFYFACNDNRADEITMTYFQTEPQTMIAERGDSVSLMYVQPSGSGAKYQGRNESFWEHQGDAQVTWGYGAPPMTCRPVESNRKR